MRLTEPVLPISLPADLGAAEEADFLMTGQLWGMDESEGSKPQEGFLGYSGRAAHCVWMVGEGSRQQGSQVCSNRLCILVPKGSLPTRGTASVHNAWSGLGALHSAGFRKKTTTV